VNYIYWLSQIQPSEKFLVGNQLYILSQLLQHERAILPGFVVSNNLLRQFLTDSDDFQSLLKELSDNAFNLDLNDFLSLQSIASRTRQLINQSVFPQALETEIFQAAQQLDSDNLILQPFFSSPSGQDLGSSGFWRSQTCNAHPQALTQAIRQVWSELFTAKGLVYRNKLGLSGQTINLEILVRPLTNAYASGIVEISKDLIKVKAAWGQPQSLLQGDVDSDEYYLDRHTGMILSRKLGHKNYGYRVKDLDLAIPSLDCLEAYIPDESQTQIYVLESKAIADLFGLTQDILQQYPQIKYLVWTIPAQLNDPNQPLTFFLTQFGEQLSASIDLFSQSTAPVLLSSLATKPILTGISAAPGKVIAKIVVLSEGNMQLKSSSIPANSVLVIKNITPHHIPLLKQVKGIITEIGGKTSHGAIVARELKIPAIVNAIDATTILSNGAEVFLNGDEGKVYPASAVQKLPLPNLSGENCLSGQQLIATKLMVNISQLQSIAPSLNLPIDGVGLLRSELMLGDILAGKSAAQLQAASFKEEFITCLVESLSQFLKAFAPRPVFYRSLDWTNQAIANPILGNRGTYSYRLDPTLFNWELQALSELVQKGYTNLNLILPFVRSVEEFQFCDHQLKNIGLTKQICQVWIMAEVPSVIWLLPEYIQAGVQGIAIGTNDLTQLLLGVDREQANFSHHGLNANHEAVHKAIAQLITIARNHQIDCCICGQATVEYPALIDKLVQWGITTISVEPEAVNRTYRAIARAERKILLNSLKFS
jgi:pyruvate, water dikinase